MAETEKLAITRLFDVETKLDVGVIDRELLLVVDTEALELDLNVLLEVRSETDITLDVVLLPAKSVEMLEAVDKLVAVGD